MRSLAKSFAVAAFGVAAASSASAALIDFTDLSTLASVNNTTATGTVDGVGFTVIATGGRLTTNAGSGPGPVGGLLGEGDGLGVRDDEIGPGQYITIIFDQEVKLTGASFLDLFRSPLQEAEEAFVYAGSPPDNPGFIGSLVATETFAPGGAGLGSLSLSRLGTTFSFDAGAGNDDQGVGDFALAGLTFDKVSIEVIPLPASALLLGTALLGVGFASRRKL